MLKAAVVILNWNGKKFLEEYLEGVVQNTVTPGIEVIVADNGSTDTSVAYLKSNFPSVKLLEFDKNYGFAGGYNRALASLEAEYFVLLNSDVRVTSGWITPLLTAMEKDNLVASCMPKIRAVEPDGYFEYAGAAGGYIDATGYPFCRGRDLRFPGNRLWSVQYRGRGILDNRCMHDGTGPAIQNFGWPGSILLCSF